MAVTPSYKVQVSRRLIEDDDGPMLDLLKAFHEQPIEIPSRRVWQPDQDQLAVRFERFVEINR